MTYWLSAAETPNRDYHNIIAEELFLKVTDD